MHFRFPVVASDGREQESKPLPLRLWDQTQKEAQSDILWIIIYKNCKRNGNQLYPSCANSILHQTIPLRVKPSLGLSEPREVLSY